MSASPKLLAAPALSVGLIAGVDDREAHRKKAIQLSTRAQSDILKANGE